MFIFIQLDIDRFYIYISGKKIILNNIKLLILCRPLGPWYLDGAGLGSALPLGPWYLDGAGLGSALFPPFRVFRRGGAWK